MNHLRSHLTGSLRHGYTPSRAAVGRRKQRVRMAIRRSVGAEDVGDLHRRAPPRARHPVGRPRRGHRLREAERFGEIQGGARAHEPPLAQMEVPHRRRDLAVAEQPLHGVQVDAGFEQVGREGVAQGVVPPCLTMPARSFASV